MTSRPDGEEYADPEFLAGATRFHQRGREIRDRYATRGVDAAPRQHELAGCGCVRRKARLGVRDTNLDTPALPVRTRKPDVIGRAG